MAERHGAAIQPKAKARPHPLGKHLPDSPDGFCSDLDLSVTASQPITAADWPVGVRGELAETSWGTLLNAWDTQWFGCSSATAEAAAAPACFLSTCGSLFGPLRSPVYLSGAGDDPDSALTQHLTTLEFQQGAYWGTSNHRDSLDLSSLAAALAGGEAGESQCQESQGSNHHQEQRFTSSTASHGSSSTTGVLQKHNGSVPCDASGTLQLSSGEAGRVPSISATAAQSYRITLLPPDSEPASDSSPIHLPARPEAGDALQPAVLGTWVHRQYHLNNQSTSQSKSQPDIASTVGGTGGTQMRSVQSQEQLKQEQEAQQEQQAKQRPAAPAMDVALEQAWRWRFQRRWCAEQARCPEDDPGSLDKHDQALEYLHAGGGTGWNMQVAVARTQSTEASGLHSMGGTQGAGSLLAGEMLLDDGSYQAVGSLARTVHRGMMHSAESATRQVNSLNRRAMHLLEQQTQLERAAEERWNTSVTSTGGDTWVGHHFSTVEIDDWGTFKFLVVRVRGRNDRQRILIRGRNYCSEGQITEEVNRKMAQLASNKGCAMETIEVMGGGVMEWRRERDRHLHLHSGFSLAAPVRAGVPKPATCHELLNLAAVLTKQHLPMHFKVSIQDC